MALSSICGLRELRLIDSNKSSVGIPPNTGPGVFVFNALFDRNKSSLRRIALTGAEAWKCDLLRLSENLTHLAVNDAGHCDGLDLFLRHASNLESLTLLDLHTLRFLPSGPDDKDLLPRLTDLKLQMDYPVTNFLINIDLVAETEHLLAFIEHHRDLRRFDFSLWPIHSDMPIMFFDDENMQDFQAPAAPWFSNIVRAVQKLEDIRALGVSFPNLPSVEMVRLAAELCRIRLLRNCTSLRLSGLDKVDLHLIVSHI